MEVLFESRIELSCFQGHLNFVQHQPIVHPDPVLLPDCAADGKLVQIYGTVLRDGGRLRMWYQAWPQRVTGKQDVAAVGYAESDDGIRWRKPPLKFIDLGQGPTNLLDLGMGIPDVWIDPDSPPSHRYRATGVINLVAVEMCNRNAAASGYFTAHSPDGLHWELDSPYPRWYSLDDINSTYHPWQRRGIIAMKYSPRVGGVWRRALYTAEFRNGVYSDPVSAIYPDEFDDICAMQHGFRSGDYYDMAFLPVRSGTVGFITNFRHGLPYTGLGHFALYGASDVTLVYQEGERGRWAHMPGRPNFIDRRAYPWMEGFITCASCPVEVGDEHWLYFSSRSFSHGFCHDPGWQAQQRWLDYVARHGSSGIGFVRWPKWRLFGFEADPDAAFSIHLGALKQPCELVLNYKAKPGGAVRAAVADAPRSTMWEQDWWRIKTLPGRAFEDCLPLTGDSIGQKVAWKSGTVIPASGERDVVVRIELEVASVYAYELRPVS
jgi:hypothetical protein